MDINSTFKELAQYKILKAEIEAELTRLEDEVKAYMTENNMDTLRGDEHSATYKAIVSNKFDSKTFQKDHKDMYDAYKKPSTSMRFTFA